jgi:hypothetical protein
VTYPSSSLVRRVLWLAVMFVMVGPFGLAVAQTPSADQLEIFRNLSPDQQQAILERTARGAPMAVRVVPSADPAVAPIADGRLPRIRSVAAGLWTLLKIRWTQY